MKIAELYRQKSFVFSIEIYPPKTQESLERLKIKLKEGLKKISRSSEGSKILKNLYGISGVLDLDGLFDPVREAARLLNMDLGK